MMILWQLLQQIYLTPAGDWGLALTVDAAINAGNSGGPVVDPLTGRMNLGRLRVGMGLPYSGRFLSYFDYFAGLRASK